MKIKLFTHTDLDGIGCAIIGKLAFGKENIDVEYCDYNNVNKKVEEFYMGSSKFNYDYVFITDISINEETFGIIKSYKDCDNIPKIKLLDHHPTALDLNKYSWVTVKIEDEKEKVSGTKLFYDYLLDSLKDNHEESFFEQEHSIYKFVEKVKRYDTWLWKTKYNDTEAKQLNDLLYIYGRDIFIDRYYDFLKNGDWYDNETFIDTESEFLLQLENNKISNYIDKKDKELISRDLIINNKAYKAGIVFAEQYLSELGNILAEKHPELDFIIMITNMNTISYRSIGNKVDLGKDVASFYGGGGHPNAAGSQISKDIKDEIIKLVFNK